MPALAMGLGWVGYTFTLYGYCLVKGYNVTLLELVNFRNVPTWASITASQVPSGQILPSGGAVNATSQPAGPGPSPSPPGLPSIVQSPLQKLKNRAARGGK